MVKSPLVSVIVPVYAAEAYLESCLESIAAQTHENLEIILVDDGSSDRSGAICEKFASIDPRTIVIHQENLGAAEARNSGLREASGQYLCFVDSDDRIMKTYVETLLEAAISHDADIAVCGYVQMFETQKRRFALEVVPTLGRKLLTGKEATEYLLGPGQMSMTLTVNKLYRSELFLDIRFSGQIYEDEQLAYRVTLAARTVVLIGSVLYEYVVRPNSVMTSEWSDKNFTLVEIYHERVHYLEEHEPSLVSIAEARYVGALLRMHSQASLSRSRYRETWLKHIRDEISQDHSDARIHMRRYDSALLFAYRVSPKLAAYLHRYSSKFRASLLGRHLFGSRNQSIRRS